MDGRHSTSTATPAPPGPRATPADKTLTPADAAPNPWLPIVQTTLVPPDEHLCKMQRALMHDATLYGERAAGDFACLGLEGAEVLDGTLFVHVAQLTAERMAGEGALWDFKGFYV